MRIAWTMRRRFAYVRTPPHSRPPRSHTPRLSCFSLLVFYRHIYFLPRTCDPSCLLLHKPPTTRPMPHRLSPFLPFNVLNYLMGVTSVTLRDFLLGSFGMLPWVRQWAGSRPCVQLRSRRREKRVDGKDCDGSSDTSAPPHANDTTQVCTCAYIGSALKGVKDVAGAARGGAAHQHKALSYTAYALGAAGTMGVVWLISQYTRRAFAEVLREDVEVGTGAVVGVAGAGGYAEMGAAGAGGGSGGQEGEEEEKEEVFEVEDDRIRGVVADMERGARREAV